MPNFLSQEYLLESKIGSLLAIKKFLNHEYVRSQRGLTNSKIFDENPYIYEIFNSKNWWKNFSLLESFWTKVKLIPTLPWETAIIIDKLEAKEIRTINEIFAEFLVKLKVSEVDLFESNQKFTLEDILKLSSNSINKSEKLIEELKIKYRLSE